ncbi:MAG: extracellular solute-binding protein [Thermomicrobiales bacterium]|nr:extracellular solute-binding protein [Thermomicrobiales bacterium]
MRTTRRELVKTGSATAAALAIGSRISPARAQEKAKIRWWHISTEDNEVAAWQALADSFVAANPNVEIEITVLENEAFKQKLATAMQSGDPPDIFQSWGGGVLFEYANVELVKDITADLATDGWGESFLPAALNLYGTDGKYYGVPWNMGVVVMWYNKALFAQAGIETTPTTWSEFLTTVQTLKDAGITPITVGEKDKWPGHFYWVYLAIRNGGKAAFDAAYTREGAFTDAPFVKAGADLKALVDLDPFQEGFLGQDYNTAEALLANGQVAMELMGHWSPSNQRGLAENGEGLGENLAFFPFPAVEGGAGGPTDVLGGGNGFAIGKNAPPEAIAFAKHLTTVDAQIALMAEGLTVPPVVKGSETSMTDPNLVEIARLLGEAEYLQLYYDQFLPPAVGAAVNDAVQGIFAGTSSPEDVAQAIEDSAAFEMA